MRYSLACSPARLLARAALALLCLASAEAQTSGPEVIGSWSKKHNWSAQIKSPNPPPPHNGSHSPGVEEIAHAALITTGQYAGHVLLWNWWDNSQQSKTWLFNPQLPQILIEVGQTLNTNIFCSGHTFGTRRYGLVVTGGYPVPPANSNQRCFRFDATQLTAAAIPPGGIYPVAGGLPWIELPSMNRRRYYPSVVSLREQLLTAPGGWTTAANSKLVLGGPQDASANGGVRTWETLAPGASAWQRLEDPNVSGFENYALMPVNDPPDSRLDSYPRALQLTNGDVYLAGEVDTVPQNGPGSPLPPNAFDLTWIVRPPGAPAGGGMPYGWQLWNSQPMGHGRHYGSAVLLHTSNPLNPEPDRLLVFGGGETNPSQGTYDPRATVQELQRNGLNQLKPWAPKTNMLHERMFLNAVVLPTMEIFLHGGLSGDSSAGPSALSVVEPELYYPGEFFANAATTRPLAKPYKYPKPIDPEQIEETPRLYHHVAVLLLDGRVLVMGGDQRFNAAIPPQPLTPPSQWTGEIYSPPYLHRGPRPAIDSAPSAALFNEIASEQRFFSVGITLPLDTSLQKFVLLRPASVTHHFDADQRYIELRHEFVNIVEDPATNEAIYQYRITSPSFDKGPSGHYLLFAIAVKAGTGPVLDRLVPSVAHILEFTR